MKRRNNYENDKSNKNVSNPYFSDEYNDQYRMQKG